MALLLRAPAHSETRARLAVDRCCRRPRPYRPGRKYAGRLRGVCTGLALGLGNPISTLPSYLPRNRSPPSPVVRWPSSSSRRVASPHVSPPPLACPRCRCCTPPSPCFEKAVLAAVCRLIGQYSAGRGRPAGWLPRGRDPSILTAKRRESICATRRLSGPAGRRRKISRPAGVLPVRSPRGSSRPVRTLPGRRETARTGSSRSLARCVWDTPLSSPRLGVPQRRPLRGPS